MLVCMLYTRFRRVNIQPVYPENRTGAGGRSLIMFISFTDFYTNRPFPNLPSSSTRKWPSQLMRLHSLSSIPTSLKPGYRPNFTVPHYFYDNNTLILRDLSPHIRAWHSKATDDRAYSQDNAFMNLFKSSYMGSKRRNHTRFPNGALSPPQFLQ